MSLEFVVQTLASEGTNGMREVLEGVLVNRVIVIESPVTTTLRVCGFEGLTPDRTWLEVGQHLFGKSKRENLERRQGNRVGGDGDWIKVGVIGGT